MRVLGISGSLRRNSHNTRLLRAAAELFPADVEFELYDELKSVPPYDEDDDVTPAPEAVDRLRAAIAAADAILISTPEYNGSVPGQLKNAIDWASRPHRTYVLLNKPAAVVGAGERQQCFEVVEGELVVCLQLSVEDPPQGDLAAKQPNPCLDGRRSLITQYFPEGHAIAGHV
ncbi:MAG: NAD(P)H-dependent oxidoreductase [Actinobacteria bacterium]|nr:MAG: NAD(P)H-dependent oxidoreductase [Actinomycetota bacterium]